MIVAATAIIYANGLAGQFVFDDIPSIVSNPTLAGPGALWRSLWPPPNRTVTGRPFLNWSFAVNHALGGDAVLGFHLVNIAVHAAAALALWGVVRRTLYLPDNEARVRQNADRIAGWATLLWAVHPLHTESVTYMVQRAESLAGLFALVTLYAFIRGATSPSPRRWLAASWLCCVLGLMTKETVAAVPILVLAYDAVFVSGGVRAALRRRAPYYTALALNLVGLVIWVRISGARASSAGTSLGVSPLWYATTQLSVVGHYLRLIAWPRPLIFDHGTRPWFGAGQGLALAAVTVLLAVMTLAAMRGRPRLGFLGLAFFVLLAPSSSVVPVVTQLGAEHRVYLALAPVAVAAALAASRLRPVACAAALVIAATALGAATIARNGDYRDPVGLWADTAAKVPDNARAHFNLATGHFERGELAAGLSAIERAIALDPTDAEAYFNRAAAFERAGDLRRAAADYAEAIAHDGSRSAYYAHRARVYVRAGRDDLAVADYTRALALRPDSADDYFNRGNARYRLGRLEEAVRDFDDALRLSPGWPEAHFNRAAAFARLGRVPEALADCEKILNLRPAYAEARRLAELLRQSRANGGPGSGAQPPGASGDPGPGSDS